MADTNSHATLTEQQITNIELLSAQLDLLQDIELEVNNQIEQQIGDVWKLDLNQCQFLLSILHPGYWRFRVREREHFLIAESQWSPVT